MNPHNHGAMITLRPGDAEDKEFLYQLYASTRAQEMALAGWDATQTANFLQLQFHARTQSYRLQYPDAVTQIVLRDGAAIGRIVTTLTDKEVLLVDIALLPACRNQGIGAYLIQALQAEAARSGKEVHVYVQATNPAQRLYRRLGFVAEGEPGIYFEMRWRPEEA